MKKILTIAFFTFFYISLGISQNIQQQRQQETERQRLEQQSIQHQRQLEAERQRQETQERQEAEQRRHRMYQNFIESAQRNFEQRRYAQAVQDYRSALELKPERATFINARIAEIDQRLLVQRQRQAETEQQAAEAQRQQEEAQRQREISRRYGEAIRSAQTHFNNRRFEQARQYYLRAREIAPENATFINQRLAYIDMRMNEPATLNVYRMRFTNGSWTSTRFNVYLGQMQIGRAAPNWKISVPIHNFGTQTVSVGNTGNRRQVQIDFQPGGVYYVRIGFVTHGQTSSPTIEVVSRNIGESEINRIEGRSRR